MQAPENETELGKFRVEVRRWLRIWVVAAQIQEETGEHGSIDDWESGWLFANQCASETTPELIARTIMGLRVLDGMFAEVERLAEVVAGSEEMMPPFLFRILSDILDGLVHRPTGLSGEQEFVHLNDDLSARDREAVLGPDGCFDSVDDPLVNGHVAEMTAQFPWLDS